VRPIRISAGQAIGRLESHLAFYLFQFGGIFVLSRLNLAVTLADLLLDFFGNDVYGRVQVAFAGLGEQVGPPHRNLHGTIELPFRHAAMVVLEGDARVNGPPIQMVQLLDLLANAIGERFRQRNVMERKNQFHHKQDAIAGEENPVFPAAIFLSFRRTGLQ
jgi:hypothetical protein